MRLQLLARDVIAKIVPIDPSPGAQLEKFEERKKLEVVLRLDPSVTSSLTAGAAILAPLTTSLLGLLLSND